MGRYILRFMCSMLMLFFFSQINIVFASEPIVDTNNVQVFSPVDLQNQIHEFRYDKRGRLNSVVFSKYGRVLDHSITYDNNGNLLESKTNWFVHGFEENFPFSIFQFPNGEKITDDSLKVIRDKHSVFAEAVKTQDWYEFLHTDNQKIQFEPNTTYEVIFQYKIHELPGDEGNFYFLARADQSFSYDRGWTNWTGTVGETGTKKVRFTTGNSLKYNLIWGIHNGGSLSIDDIQITKIEESFESGRFDVTIFNSGYNSSGEITYLQNMTIDGNFSVLGEAQNAQDWDEFLHTDLQKFRLEPNTTYEVNFQYKVNKKPGDQGHFYFLARGAYEDFGYDRGWTNWTGEVGEVGNQKITFTTGNLLNYYLIWGLHNGGSLSIDDIQIIKIEESFESGSFDVTIFNSGYNSSGKITNLQNMIIDGNFSVLGEAQITQDWDEFLHTDLQKFRLDPNTTYEVNFQYKINKLAEGGNFYFLARGAYEDFSYDRGWSSWTGSVGTIGTQKVKFTTGNLLNYYLIWGIHNGGSLSIDNISIRKS